MARSKKCSRGKVRDKKSGKCRTSKKRGLKRSRGKKSKKYSKKRSRKSSRKGPSLRQVQLKLTSCYKDLARAQHIDTTKRERISEHLQRARRAAE